MLECQSSRTRSTFPASPLPAASSFDTRSKKPSMSMHFSSKYHSSVVFRYAEVSESQDKVETSGQSSPASSSFDTGSEWRRNPGGFGDSDTFSDAVNSNVRASWGMNSVNASFDSAGPGNVRASQKVGGNLSRLGPSLEERSDVFGGYNASKWADDSTPSPAAKPFKPAGLGNILPAGDDIFSEAGSGRFSPQAEKVSGSFDDGDPFNLRADKNPSTTSAFMKTNAWSAFD